MISSCAEQSGRSVNRKDQVSKDQEAKPQPDKFRDLARQLEADEDPAHFEETLKKVVHKPASEPPKAD